MLLRELIIICSLLLLVGNLFSCQKTKRTLDNEQDTTKYTGPLVEFKGIETYYSLQAMVRVRLTAPIQWRYGNANEEFPKGINLEMFNEAGLKSTLLVADYAIYEAAKQKYTVTGRVKVTNLIENQTLESPRLYWLKREREILSDTSVIVTSAKAKLYGIGLKAQDDFSRYKILEPTGPISFEE
jgi:LPS export ABC transporter protein LptC